MIPRFLVWVSGGRSFTERDNRRRSGFAEKSGEPGLGDIELEMPRYHKMELSGGLWYTSKSPGAACTLNIKWAFSYLPHLLVNPSLLWDPCHLAMCPALVPVLC